MAKLYDQNAILYRWLYKAEDGVALFIGTDPALADRAKFFRWRDESGGWDRREPWSQGASDVQPIDNAAGTSSGWPGSVPLPGRGPGRPRKEVADDDRLAAVTASIRRSELFEIQRRAAEARKSVSEWIACAIRAQLGGGER
jgi:hypothetical protein